MIRKSSVNPNPLDSDCGKYLLLVLVCAGGAEIVAVWLLVYGYGSLLILLCGHLGGCGLILAVRRREKRHAGDVLVYLAFVLFFALGPLGAFLFGLFRLLYPILNRKDRTLDEHYNLLFPDTSLSREEELSIELEELSEDYNVTPPVPFVDIMSHGNYQQKMEALELISKRFQPIFMPALQVALHDCSNPVRVMAATVHSKIAHYYMARSIKIRKTLSESPSPRQLLEAARHYDSYAYSGLLNESQAQEKRAQALDCYRQYIALQPDAANDAAVAIGRILVRSGDYPQAEDWLVQQMQVVGTNGELLIWYLESLYRQGKYELLQQVVRAQSECFSDASLYPPAVIEMFRFWSHAGARSAPSG